MSSSDIFTKNVGGSDFQQHIKTDVALLLKPVATLAIRRVPVFQTGKGVPMWCLAHKNRVKNRDAPTTYH
jgi:hypothetical protein